MPAGKQVKLRFSPERKLIRVRDLICESRTKTILIKLQNYYDKVRLVNFVVAVLNP